MDVAPVVVLAKCGRDDPLIFCVSVPSTTDGSERQTKKEEIVGNI